MRLLPLVLLAVLALVPTAGAATIRVDLVCINYSGKGPETCSNVLAFQAAPGEANNVTADPPAAGSIVFRDAGAPLTAAGACTQVDATTARCPNAGGSVLLGDGNDRLRFPAGVEQEVFGEAGDDDLAGPKTVRGDDGNDTLSGPQLDGGEGNDVLTGTTGADVLYGDHGDDTMNGGPGRDTVDYSLRPSFGVVGEPGTEVPVTVDLADPAPDGAAGERDTLIAIENVTASDAAGDVLRGDAGPNVLDARGGTGPNNESARDKVFGAGGDDTLEGDGELDGGDGDDQLEGGGFVDVLRGGAGEDAIAGNLGADVLEGGSGDDLLDTAEHADYRSFDVDEVRCGTGRDRVVQPDISDRASSCERIAVGGGLVVDSSTLRKRSGPRVEVVVLCRRDGRRCVTKVASAAASGSAFNPNLPVSLAPGAKRKLVLKRFHPNGKARLRRSKVIAFGTKDHGFAVRLR